MKPRRKKNKRSTIRAWGRVCFFLAISLFFAWGIKKLDLKAFTFESEIDFSKYQPIEAKVVDVDGCPYPVTHPELRRGVHDTCLNITFEWEVDGRIYQGGKYNFSRKEFIPIGDMGGWAYWRGIKYNNGTIHTIYYNRDLPRDAVMSLTVRREAAFWPWYFVWLFGAIAVLNIPGVLVRLEEFYNRITSRG